jgi:hypothetical protein
MKEIPIFQGLQPTEGQRDSNISFDVRDAKPAHAPSVKSLGLFSQLVGSRADFIICDDGETPNNSLTEDSREKLLKAMGEFESILSPGGRICFLGTPQNQESVYNKLRRGRGYKTLIIPARFPNPETASIYEGCLASYLLERIQAHPELVSHSTDPKRFSDQDLAEREASIGRTAFALQFMLDTSLSDSMRYPLKTSDLCIVPLSTDRGPINISYGASPELTMKEIPNIGLTGDRFYRPFFVDKEFAPYEGAVMLIDPAGTGGDELAYAVVKQLHGYLYLMDSGGLLGGYKEENLRTLAKIAKEHQVKEIVTEQNMGAGMFDQLLKPILGQIYPCSINSSTDGKGIRNTVQKEKRIIDTLEPVLNRHKLIVDETVVRKDLKFFARYLEIFGLLFMIFMIVSFVISIPNVKVTNLFPVTTKDIGSIALSTYPLLGIGGYMTFMFFLGNMVSNKQEFKSHFKKVCPILVVAGLAVILLTVGIFGSDLVQSLNMPFFVFFKNIEILNIFERLESVLITFWTVTDFAIVTTFTYIAVKLIKKTFNLNSSKEIVTPFLFICFILSLYIASNVEEVNLFSKYISLPVNIIYGFIIPIILLIVGKIRKKI